MFEKYSELLKNPSGAPEMDPEHRGYPAGIEELHPNIGVDYAKSLWDTYNSPETTWSDPFDVWQHGVLEGKRSPGQMTDVLGAFGIPQSELASPEWAQAQTAWLGQHPESGGMSGGKWSDMPYGEGQWLESEADWYNIVRGTHETYAGSKPMTEGAIESWAGYYGIPYETPYGDDVVLNPVPDPDDVVQVDSCFLPKTVIATIDGQKSIKDIKIKDKIFTGNGTMVQVIRKGIHRTDNYLVINDFLKVTSTHPILVNNKWTQIGKANVGDKLASINGKEIVINSIESCNKKTIVYNLEVEPPHTFYADGILSHNKMYPPEEPKLWTEDPPYQPDDSLLSPWEIGKPEWQTGRYWMDRVPKAERPWNVLGMDLDQWHAAGAPLPPGYTTGGETGGTTTGGVPSGTQPSYDPSSPYWTPDDWQFTQRWGQNPPPSEEWQALDKGEPYTFQPFVPKTSPPTGVGFEPSQYEAEGVPEYLQKWLNDLGQPIETEIGLSERERQSIYNLGRGQIQGATRTAADQMRETLGDRGFRAGETGFADTPISQIYQTGQRQMGEFGKEIAISEAQRRFDQQLATQQLGVQRMVAGGGLAAQAAGIAAQERTAGRQLTSQERMFGTQLEWEQARQGQEFQWQQEQFGEQMRWEQERFGRELSQEERLAQQLIEWEQQKYGTELEWEKYRFGEQFGYQQERDVMGDLFNYLGLAVSSQQARYQPYWQSWVNTV